MDKLKIYISENFEQVIVFASLVSMLFIHYFVQQKMAFLNFYYLPVLFAGYFLGRRSAVLASFFCILLVVIFFMATPQFFSKVEGNFEIILNLTLWGSFLMLTSYVTGTLFEHKGKCLQDLKNAYIGVLEILSKYLEASDRYTQGHSIRVSQLATEIAIAMQLPRAKIENIKAAALLHDIGKVEVSMDLIQKASSLSAEEKKAVDTHSEKGANILSSVGNVLREAVPMVQVHHKHYEELESNKSLPNDAKIGACIIAVADTYDAIITDRPYRAGKTPSKALEEIEKESGNQFHPEAVKAFKRVFETRYAELEDNVFSLNE
jgi:putative nucleotidyltransferase with HDIG domain